MSELTEFECGWLSAAIDGEGTIGMFKRKTRKWYRVTSFSGIRARMYGDYILDKYGYGFTVEVSTTDFGFVNNSREICGGGRRVTPRRKDPRGNRKDLWRWSMTLSQVRTVLPQLILITKKVQAEYALLFTSLYDSLFHTPINEEERVSLEETWKEMTHLNKRGRALEVETSSVLLAPILSDEPVTAGGEEDE